MDPEACNSTLFVLVVEDDFIVRMVLAEALVDAGFIVFEAVDATQAVDILNAEAERLHALFTDVQMPGEMDGVMLAHHARRRWPWICQLITSGRVDPSTRELPEGARYIPKPYDVGTVMRHIREMAA